jgi:hypothetical protein
MKGRWAVADAQISSSAPRLRQCAPALRARNRCRSSAEHVRCRLVNAVQFLDFVVDLAQLSSALHRPSTYKVIHFNRIV